MNLKKIYELTEVYNNSLLPNESNNKVDLSKLKSMLQKGKKDWNNLSKVGVNTALYSRLEKWLDDRETREEYLLRNYNPLFPSIELKKLIKDKACIVFNPKTNHVMVSESTKLLEENDEREFVYINKDKVRVYRWGQLPDNFKEPNLLFPTRLLENGVCSETDFNWNRVGTRIKEIIYNAINVTKELKINNINDAKHLISLIKDTGSAENRLKLRYPKACKI